MSLTYDTATEVTLTGTVEKITDHSHARMQGKHLELKTGTETIEVHLGPSGFLSKQKFAVMQSDRVEIRGSRVKVDGKDAIIARWVKRGDVTWTLRNDKGVPEWSGRGGRMHRHKQ